MTENRTVCEIYLHGMRQLLCQDWVETLSGRGYNHQTINLL